MSEKIEDAEDAPELSDRDIADLRARQDQIIDVLVGIQAGHALAVLAWVAAGCIHQAVEPREPVVRGLAIAGALGDHFKSVVNAINQIEGSCNGDCQQHGVPKGVTVN